MNGRFIVMALVLLCIAVGVGAVWYRASSRPRHLQDLADAREPKERSLAFARLLRANGLYGIARETIHDPRQHGAARPYVQAVDSEGNTFHVVQASTVNEEGTVQPATVVIDGSGMVRHMTRQTRALLLEGNANRGRVVLVGTAAGDTDKTVRIVGKKLEEILRVRGTFRLETAAGVVNSDGWELVTGSEAEGRRSDSIRLYRYDPETSTLR